MTAFRYDAIDASGRNSRGVIEADTLRHARSNLRESGLTVISIQLVSQSNLGSGIGTHWRERFRSGLSNAQLSIITRQLATLLAAGLTLEQAFNALIEQSENETARQILAGVRGEILAGHTLAYALGKYETIFPDIYRALVKAGEATGELGQVMSRLADYTESRQALQQKVGLRLSGDRHRRGAAGGWRIINLCGAAGRQRFPTIAPNLATTYTTHDRLKCWSASHLAVFNCTHLCWCICRSISITTRRNSPSMAPTNLAFASYRSPRARCQCRPHGQHLGNFDRQRRPVTHLATSGHRRSE
jgi:hypothetical protein